MAGALLALPSTGRAIGPPPANDGFAAAAVIGGLPFSQTVDNSLAAIEPGEPNGCTSAAPAHTVWYRYQPAADGALTLDTRGTDFRTTSIAVYTGAAVDQLTLVKCRLTASDPSGRLTVPVAAGTVYAVQVGSQSAASYGRMTLNAYIGGGLTGTVVDGDGRPVDACVSVLDADERAFATGYTSTAGAYRISDLPPGSYRFRTRNCSYYYPTFADDVADVPVEVTAGEVREIPPVSVLRIGAIVGRVTTTDGAPASGLCVDVWNKEEGYTRWTTTNADGAYTFYLAPGTYELDINCSGYDQRFSRQVHEAVAVGGPGTTTVIDAVLEQYSPPANDAFAAASVKQGDFEDTVSLNRATVEPGEPRECGYYSVWYRWTPGFTGTVALDVTGYATAVGVYRGEAVDSLEQVACQDTTVIDPPPEPAVLVPVEAGQTYYVRVAAFGGGTPVATVRATRLRGGAEATVDQATTPCAAACPYWTNGGDPYQEQYDAACRPDPLAPPGSWQDHSLTVPADVAGRAPAFLVLQFDPELDYDGFVCRKLADKDGAYALGSTADPVAGECAQRGDLGCPEDGVFRVQPGDELVLRFYNWAATGPVTAQYRYAG